MSDISRWSFARIALFTVGLSAGAIAPFIPVSSIVIAQTNSEPFPDIQTHWARPFISSLASEEIVKGYLDGTYRPEQSVNRDEFAALVSQAFDREPVREIASGSVYQDIPEGYWAAGAIESAYEQGFVASDPNGFFRPNQPISRLDVLTSLSRNLNLQAVPATTEQATPAPTETPAEQPDEPTTTQDTSRRVAKRPLMFPLAMTTLMQPVFQAPKQVTGQAAVPPPTDNQQEASSEQTPPAAPPGQETSGIVDQYYADADQIPAAAIGDVAAATQAGIVVNYPEPNLLKPNQPVTRGEMAAFIHQALVHQDRLAPLPEGEASANYIVGR